MLSKADLVVLRLRAQWQQNPQDGVQRFCIGNMNRFVDIYTAKGQQLAQLGGEGITAYVIHWRSAYASLYSGCGFVNNHRDYRLPKLNSPKREVHPCRPVLLLYRVKLTFTAQYQCSCSCAISPLSRLGCRWDRKREALSVDVVRTLLELHRQEGNGPILYWKSSIQGYRFMHGSSPGDDVSLK